MKVVLLMVASFVGYIIVYHTYGRFLARRIFKLDDTAHPPSKALEDGVDYVPTRRGVIFGHHFTSISGTGPIVGPAIGIIWGWVPAFIWVFVGSIVMGAVHDFGALVISMRNDGKSIAEASARYINRRVRTIFFLVIFLGLWIVIAIFGLIIAVLFKEFAGAVFPVWAQIPIAVWLGYMVYKRNGNLTLFTLIAVVAMYVTVIVGSFWEIHMPAAIAGIPATGVWTIILLAYAYVASTLPVTTLLQPRDYINAWQLFVAMGLLVLGVFVSGFGGQLEFVAPAFNPSPKGAPALWPFLFITIACGAISGFHSLVSSGTTAKQISKESDAQFVGYGSMLTEGFLGVLVIIAVAAGIGIAFKTTGGEILTGSAAWQNQYSEWIGEKGLGVKLAAVVTGSANMLGSLGIPAKLGTVIIGVFIASFAGTTLDTATRIQRYVIAELAHDFRIPVLPNRWAATGVAVGTALVLAFATGATGAGAMKLWPMFGSLNQLLAALALLVITIYLKRRVGAWSLLTGLPCVFMLVMTVWAVVLKEHEFLVGKPNALLAGLNGATLLLSLWMIIEAAITLFRSTTPEQEAPG